LGYRIPGLGIDMAETARQDVTNAAERRVPALDGFRGLMTIVVVVSHFFAELPHGFRAAGVGWIAVDAFFVLSGFLIANLILDKIEHVNFFSVFYVRRACRTLPSYFLCVIVLFFILSLLSIRESTRQWADVDDWFPLWSYLTMTQNFFMMATATIGQHWLAPTWTLALEEHFYLVAPMLFFLVPRRHLFAVLTSLAVLAVALRAAFVLLWPGMQIGALVLLPSRADTLICGMLLPVAFRTLKIDWARWEFPMRLVPLIALLSLLPMRMLGGEIGNAVFEIFGHFVVAVGSAFYILGLWRGTPEAKSYQSPVLRFFGSISYSTYLTHLAVLGLFHGVLLGSRPDLTTPAQWGVSVLAFPFAILAGWILTKLVEEPITAYGRSWKWGEKRAPRAIEALAAS
jgi:peptidoglycan/LPS O-acetylase OafA/YrhL